MATKATTTIPFHNTPVPPSPPKNPSTNYIDAQTSQSASVPSKNHKHSNPIRRVPGPAGQEEEASPYDQEVKIPDGRRNSQGEVIASPTESWKPNFGRKQSWDPQEYKRKMSLSLLEDDAGNGCGFTEGGPGTRKVGE
jgi:hypothetical protein